MAAQRVAEPGLGTSDLVDGGRGVTLHNVLADALGVVHDERQPLAAADGVVLGAVDAVAAGATKAADLACRGRREAAEGHQPSKRSRPPFGKLTS